MAEKKLKTRIALKIDTLENWQSTALGADKGANYVLKRGEIGLVEIPNTIPPVPGTEPSEKTEVMFKVGNGSTKFSALPWASAMAADVYDWAKKATKPTYGTDEINGLSTRLSGIDTAVSKASNAASAAQQTANKGVTNAATAQSKADSAYNLANGKQSPATTLAGYGITDAKIAGQTITLGGNSIDVLTATDIANKAENSTVSAIDTRVKTAEGEIDTLQGYFTKDGKANKAVADENNKNIATTYATKTELTTGLGKKLDSGATAADSAKLNGQEASYYATKTEVDAAQNKADSAYSLAEGKLSKGAQAADSARLEGKTKTEVIAEARTGYATTGYVDNKVAASVQYLGVATSVATLSTDAGMGDFYRANFDRDGVNKGDLLIAAKNNPTASIDDTNGYSIVKSSDDYVGTVKQVIAGDGIVVDKSSSGEATYTVSHKDTSSQASSTNSGRTYIQSIGLDTYGHVTSLSTGTETVVDTNTWRDVKVNGTSKINTGINTGAIDFVNGTNTTVEFASGNKIKINGAAPANNGTFTVSGSDGITGSGSGSANQSGSTSATLKIDWSVVAKKSEIPTVGNGTFTVTGGNGLTGSGSSTANQSGNTNVTLAVGEGPGITVEASSVSVKNYGTLLTSKNANGGKLVDCGDNEIVFDCGGATD